MFQRLLLLLVLTLATALPAAAQPVLRTDHFFGNACTAGSRFKVRIFLDNNSETLFTAQFRLRYPSADYRFIAATSGPNHDGIVGASELPPQGSDALYGFLVAPTDLTLLFKQGILLEVEFEARRNIVSNTRIEIENAILDLEFDRREPSINENDTNPLPCAPTPTPSPTPSPSPSRTPVPTTTVPTTTAPTATATTTPNPTTTAVPTTTAGPTATATSTASPTATNATPTPTPINQVLFFDTFDDRTVRWTCQNSSPEVFSPVFFSNPPGYLSITGSGSSNAFGFCTSPRITVTGGSTLEILWTVRSLVEPQRVPQFRLRVNESRFRSAQVLALESTQPGTGPTPGGTVYTMIYTVPEGANAIELAFDMVSVNPNDDLRGSVELLDVRVRRLF